MVVFEKLKEAEMSEQDSLLLTQNLLRMAIFKISYVRGLFPDEYFDDESVPALDMEIKKLMPMDAESRVLIDWMEKGVNDALQRKYLKTLVFCIWETVFGPGIEEYAFSFSYSDSDSQHVTMNISRNGNKKHGGTSDSTAAITPNQMRSPAWNMVQTLDHLTRTLDKLPDECTIVMKLQYHADSTPPEYETPFFRGSTEQESQYVWTSRPLRMKVGNWSSKHLILTPEVKSDLDPCEDENDDEKSAVPDHVHEYRAIVMEQLHDFQKYSAVVFHGILCKLALPNPGNAHWHYCFLILIKIESMYRDLFELLTTFIENNKEIVEVVPADLKIPGASELMGAYRTGSAESFVRCRGLARYFLGEMNITGQQLLMICPSLNTFKEIDKLYELVAAKLKAVEEISREERNKPLKIKDSRLNTLDALKYLGGEGDSHGYN